MPPQEVSRSVPGQAPSTTGAETATIHAVEESQGRIEAEHRALREMLSRIEATRDLATLLPLLQELQVTLHHHFETEEAPAGLHSAIAGSAPEKTRALEALFREHVELLEHTRRLMDATRECLAGPVREILDAVGDLARRLHLHQENETDLFVDVVNTDLGGSG